MPLTNRKLRFQDFWYAIAFFVISMAVTLAMFSYVRYRNAASGQRLFEQASQAVQADLLQTLQVYGLFLSSGSALFHASDYVSRAEWRSFVETIDLAGNYPGIQGVSYNPVLRGPTEFAEFLARVQRDDRSTFDIRPPGTRELYAPILYLEPLNERNAPALGFDIYSEARRRDAIDRAIARRVPQMTSKITLVQAGPGGSEPRRQPGFLIVLPIFEDTSPADTQQDDRGLVTGVIVSVFEVDVLMENTLKRAGARAQGSMSIDIFDGLQTAPEAALFRASDQEGYVPHDAMFEIVIPLQLFGRDWTYRAQSTAAFEAAATPQTQYIVLATGTLISLLFTALAVGQALRTHESRVAAERLASSNSKIGYLLGEVNHRSKNLLSVIQVIARQTSDGAGSDFAETFSQRLSALAQSQDLLVRNEWKSVDMRELVSSQLAHFKTLIGTRIEIDGPQLAISASSAQTIGMAIHELATNAAKYGALSNDVGLIAVNWDVTANLDKDDDVFTMTWIEQGGPAVVAPKKTGFGSKVTGQIAKMSLSGKVQTLYNSQGLEWTLSCKRSKVQEEEPQDA